MAVFFMPPLGFSPGGWRAITVLEFFCDDVTLARNVAALGSRWAFRWRKVLKVRMYEGAAQTWKEWGRSLDLKDASSSCAVGIYGCY